MLQGPIMQHRQIESAAVPVPTRRVASPEQAPAAAAAIGFPIAIKALDARLLHKTECGAVRIGLADVAAVEAALAAMLLGQDVRSAIKLASKVDMNTGGRVKVLNLVKT